MVKSIKIGIDKKKKKKQDRKKEMCHNQKQIKILIYKSKFLNKN